MAEAKEFLDYDGLSEFKSGLNGVDIVTTAGTGAAYTATVPGITALKAGLMLTLIPHVTSTSKTCTLNLNSLGAKSIRRRLTNSTVSTVASSSDNWIYKNKPIRVTYDGTYWIADMDRPNAADIYGTMPIANGGTGATTAEQARANLGITSGISKTLLWENSAPDEEMVYTELTIDNMNDYDGIEIIWYGNTDFDLRNTGFIPLCQPDSNYKFITTTLIFDVYDPTNVPPIYVRCFRDIQISSLKTGVPNASHAANNMVKIHSGCSNSSEDEEGIGYIEDNGVCIPYRIYGIKGVQ